MKVIYPALLLLSTPAAAKTAVGVEFWPMIWQAF
jgi:hypothetical protein